MVRYVVVCALLLELLGCASSTAGGGTPPICAQLYCWEPSCGSVVPPHDIELERSPSAAAYFARDQAKRAQTHLKRAKNLTAIAFEKLGPAGEDDEDADIEAVFPYLWSALQEAVALTEKAGSNSEAWNAVVSLLNRIYERRVLNQIKLRTVAEYMRKTLSMSKSHKRAAHYLKWLKSLPDLSETGPNAPEGASEIRAFAAQLEKEVATGDGRFRAEDCAVDLFLPGMPQLLAASRVEASTRDYMTTHSLWPTRISTVPLAKRFHLTARFNRLLNTAAVEARNTYANSQPGRNPSSINNGFFQAQYEVEYSFLNKQLRWCQEGDTGCKMRGKGLRMFGNAEQRDAVEKLMKYAHTMCVEHTIRSGGARAQSKAMFDRATIFIWAAVYTPVRNACQPRRFYAPTWLLLTDTVLRALALS